MIITIAELLEGVHHHRCRWKHLDPTVRDQSATPKLCNTSAKCRWVVSTARRFKSMYLCMFMVLKTHLQAEHRVEDHISRQDLPGLLDDVAMRVFHAIAASIDLAKVEVSAALLEESRLELFHMRFFPSSAASRPLPVELGSLIFQQGFFCKVHHLEVHWLLPATSFKKNFTSVVIVEVCPITVEGAGSADPKLLGLVATSKLT